MLLDHQGTPDLSDLRPQAGETEQVNATTENISEFQITVILRGMRGHFLLQKQRITRH